MINKNFEAYKIKREIKRSGVEYEFKRRKLNDFNECSGEEISIGKVKGIYHESTYANETAYLMSKDSSQTRSKKTPMILCLYDDVAFLDLHVNDLVSFNNKTFKVVSLSNIQEWNIVVDIFLEVVDDGI